MSSPIEQAIRQICEEKGLAYEAVIAAIEAALAAAYRKDFGDKNQNIEVTFNPETGATEVFDVKTVVEDMDLEDLARMDEERKKRAEELAQMIADAREHGQPIPAISIDEELAQKFNPKTDIMLSDARVLKFSVQIGDVLRSALPMGGEFGRMAAMTAKQVIMQKLREAEREIVFNQFKEVEGQVLNGHVQRREGRMVLIDLGRTTGIIRPEDQIPGERYNTGDRIRVHVRQVSLGSRGPEILLSRTSDELVRELFFVEIPEIAEGRVAVNAIAREAGARSKVAVSTSDTQIDPIGACIGQRGTRIQTIISELGGEKIDIIEWNDDAQAFIANALSPAKIDRVELNAEEKIATVHVKPDQLSLAIGRGGQNVRLASRLSGWKINIAEHATGAADAAVVATAAPTGETEVVEASVPASTPAPEAATETPTDVAAA